MVQSTTPSPLVIIPHGDFEKQVFQRLDEALASGFIKQDKYQELRSELQWVLPFQQEQFMVHLNVQIRDASPTLISNPNVRPSAASSTTEAAKTVHVTDDSDLYNTDNWWNDKFSSSAPIPTSSPSTPQTITPPTSVPAAIQTPMTTKVSAHDHVYSDSIPCRDLAATSSIIQTDTNNLAQSASSNSVNQRISHIKNILRNLPRITVGKHEFLLPPIPTTSEVNIQKSLQFQDSEVSEAHISQSDLSLQLQVQNPQQENPHSAIITPNAQLDARRSSTYISTVINQFCPKSPILAESANIKVNTSQSLLFNPQCDHTSGQSLTNQSAQRPSEDSYTKISKVFLSSNSVGSSNIIIQSSIVESTNILIDLYPSSIPSAPARLMSIPSFHVGTFQFPDTPKYFSSFQFPVQCAIENSYSEF